LTVQTEGKRQVSRQISYYSLPMIMAVAPSAVEQHFAEAVGKVKAIEGARPKPVKGRER
jgi:hypothetical protein